MSDEAGRERHQHPSPKSVRFAELSAEVLAALLIGDLAAASSAAGVPLTGYFITPEALKLWRVQAAKERGVPAYIVFTDATLMAVVERRPSSLEELGEVPGIGPAKLEAYGQVLLELLA